jgi:hypothetical protein
MRDVRFRRAVASVVLGLGLAALNACVAPAGDASKSPALPIETLTNDVPVHGSPPPQATPTAFIAPTYPLDHMDADLVLDVALPAGGSLDVPLTFEGSSFATIQVVGVTPGVTASFGGTALDSGSLVDFTALSTSMSNPTDGSLHIVNPGTTAATVTLVARVQTTRHLTTTPPIAAVAKGGTLSFDVQLSEATDGDGASAYLQDQTGARTPIALTEVGMGHWTGQVAPTVSGTSEIHAQTSGARVRYGTCLISVSTGNVTFGSGFTERLADTDHDGLANQLELTPTVTALRSGSYSVTAHLVNASGTEVTVTGRAISLVAGTQPLKLDFDGASIYKAGLAGPYHLVNVSLTDENADPSFTEATATDLGATQAYNFHVFQH